LHYKTIGDLLNRRVFRNIFFFQSTYVIYKRSKMLKRIW